MGRGQDTEVPVREFAFKNPPPNVFSQTKFQMRGLRYPIVQLTGFPPQSKLAGANIALHAFGSGADAGELVVVNRARAVHGNVIDEATLHQVDDMAIDARTDDVTAYDEDARCPDPSSGLKTRRYGRKIFVLKFGRYIAECQPAIEMQIVNSFRERFQKEPGSV